MLLHQGLVQAAANLLQHEVTVSPVATDPRFYFHLAMCLERLDDVSGAADALDQAFGLGLARSFLTVHERSELDRLSKHLSVDLGR